MRHDSEELAGSTSAKESHDRQLIQELKNKEKNLRAKLSF
jgi:hypothetical protein